MKVTIIEGTPDEIAKALPHLSPPNLVTTTVIQPSAGASATVEDELVAERGNDSDSSAESNASGDEVKYVTTELARSVLTRRDLSKEQLLVLETLYKDHPKTVPSMELMKTVGYTRDQFSGLMGAFGRRISHTPGYEAQNGPRFFVQKWDKNAGCNWYGLPDSVLEAMRLEKLV
jgi:hypothetical protein